MSRLVRKYRSSRCCQTSLSLRLPHRLGGRMSSSWSAVPADTTGACCSMSSASAMAGERSVLAAAQRPSPWAELAGRLTPQRRVGPDALAAGVAEPARRDREGPDETAVHADLRRDGLGEIGREQDPA